MEGSLELGEIGRFLIPLRDPPAVAYFRDHLFVVHSLRQRVARRLLGPPAVPILARLVSGRTRTTGADGMSGAAGGDETDRIWLFDFDRDPGNAVDELLRGIADLAPYERAGTSVPRAAQSHRWVARSRRRKPAAPRHP